MLIQAAKIQILGSKENTSIALELREVATLLNTCDHNLLNLIAITPHSCNTPQ
jgi:hypothetical protein